MRFINLKDNKIQLALMFLWARLIMAISAPLEGLKSYGDYWNFYQIASLGTPFKELWVEFPPLFPFISRGIYLLAGGREHIYIYFFVFTFSLAQAGSLYLYQVLAERLFPEKEAKIRGLLYGFTLVSLFYGWAYFDSLAVFCMLLSIYLHLENRNLASGFAVGIGGLIKWFPVLILPALLRKQTLKQIILVILTVGGVIALVWGGLLLAFPDYSWASLISQGTKGSWESIWALIDGNLTTGNFDPQINRLIPDTAAVSSGSPAVISPLVTLLIFGAMGLIIYLKADLKSPGDLVAMMCFTFLIFYLWSPGYSPQWILFLLPLVLSSFSIERSALISISLILISLLEWPVLLSRGLFNYLEEIVIFRNLLFILIAVILVHQLFSTDSRKTKEI
jgi:hypothetical protein